MHRRIAPMIAGVALLVFWQAFVNLFHISPAILPSPLMVSRSLVGGFGSISFHVGVTLFESFVGFLIGSVVGIGIAVAFLRSPTLKDAGYPYMVAIKATPVFALAPLFVLWFGNGLLTKIVMAATVVFFPVLINTYKGLSSVPREHLELFQSMSASPWQVFWKLRLPSALPFMFSAFRISSTFALVGATIAEFTGASAGAGHLIMKSSYYLDTGLMFASIIMLSLTGILFFKLVEFVERKVVFWQKGG